MVLMNSASPASPSAQMASGVWAIGNSLRVARFTPLSVACADSTTATSNSNGVVYSSSVVGWGLAARRRLKISRRLAGFMAIARSASLRLERLFQRLIFGLPPGAGRFLVRAGTALERRCHIRIARLEHALLQRRLHAATGTAARARWATRALFQLFAAISSPSPRKAPGGRIASKNPR